MIILQRALFFFFFFFFFFALGGRFGFFHFLSFSSLPFLDPWDKHDWGCYLLCLVLVGQLFFFFPFSCYDDAMCCIHHLPVGCSLCIASVFQVLVIFNLHEMSKFTSK